MLAPDWSPPDSRLAVDSQSIRLTKVRDYGCHVRLACLVLIRDATATEMPQVGDVRSAAYHAGGFLSADPGYEPHLRGLGADGHGHVLVAVEPGPTGSSGPGERLVGTVMLQFWPHAGRVVTGPGEAEVRALAVLPAAQGAGVGRALVRAAVERAVRTSVRHLVLFTQPEMRTAHRLYEEAGFSRLPERDWSPAAGVMLIGYGLRLRL